RPNTILSSALMHLQNSHHYKKAWFSQSKLRLLMDTKWEPGGSHIDDLWVLFVRFELFFVSGKILASTSHVRPRT
ncbi:MAG: hypothetical protein ACFFCB_08515, partial [Candidatus Odinarchaeota archaeon]